MQFDTAGSKLQKASDKEAKKDLKDKRHDEKEEARVHKDMKRGIVAAMETGNYNRARMLLTEYDDVLPALAEALRIELVGAYGTSL